MRPGKQRPAPQPRCFQPWRNGPGSRRKRRSGITGPGGLCGGMSSPAASSPGLRRGGGDQRASQDRDPSPTGPPAVCPAGLPQDGCGGVVDVPARGTRGKAGAAFPTPGARLQPRELKSRWPRASPPRTSRARRPSHVSARRARHTAASVSRRRYKPGAVSQSSCEATKSVS